MFDQLNAFNRRPKPFEYYTASDLWTDPHISKQMLSYHLDLTSDISSRNGGFIDRSIEWIVSYFQLAQGMRVADFGCGPGLYTSRLAKQQLAVTGIDFSQGSIDYAKNMAEEEGLTIDYVNQNYLAYEAEKQFDLCLMITCDFSVLSPTQRKTMLDRFHDSLKPGGHVLLDVNGLCAFDKRREKTVYEYHPHSGFWSSDPHHVFLKQFKYDTEKVALDKYTIVEKSLTRTIYNWFQHFDPDDLEAEFTASGFQVVGYYSDVAGSPYVAESKEIAVVAKKRT